MIEPRAVWLSSPSCFLAFGCGSGLARVAPGTFGTLAAVPVYFLLRPLEPWSYLALVVVFFGLGVVFCARATRALGVHDHSAIVWDEVVGYLLTMAMAPAVWWAPVAGFFLFRFFDILKPWPIGWIDRKVDGGLGIMLDDAMAAIPAWCIMQWAARLL